MDELLRRIRGLLGIGLTWGTAWAAIGALIGMVILMVTPDGAVEGTPVLDWALGMGLYGLVSGIGFGQVLALKERQKTIAELSLPRVATWGVVGSAAVPLLFGALGTFETGTTVVDVVEAMLVCAVLGGSFASGSVALARRVGPGDERSELGAGAGDRLGEEAGRRLLTGEPVPDRLPTSTRARDAVG